MRPGRLTVADVAARLGCSRWTARRRMWEWHEEHGGLLERARGEGTTLYIVEARLLQLEQWQDTREAKRRLAALESRVDRVEAFGERTRQIVDRMTNA